MISATLTAIGALAPPAITGHSTLSSHRSNHGTIATRIYRPHVQKYHSGTQPGQSRIHRRSGHLGRLNHSQHPFGFGRGYHGCRLYYYSGYPAYSSDRHFAYSYPSYAYYDYSYRPQYTYPVQVAAAAVSQSPPATGAQSQTVVVKSSSIYAAEQERLINEVLKGDAMHRLHGVESLVEFRNIGSVAVLQEAMINDANVAVRTKAAQSLGVLGASIAYITLLRSQSYDGNAEVRNAATGALDEIRRQTDPALLPTDPRLIPMNFGRVGLGDYLEILRFGDSDQRRAAIQHLADRHGTQAIVGIVNSLINDPDVFVRHEAAIQLAKVRDPLVLPFLDSAATQDPERRVRLQALNAIKKNKKAHP